MTVDMSFLETLINSTATVWCLILIHEEARAVEWTSCSGFGVLDCVKGWMADTIPSNREHEAHGLEVNLLYINRGKASGVIQLFKKKSSKYLVRYLKKLLELVLIEQKFGRKLRIFGGVCRNTTLPVLKTHPKRHDVGWKPGIRFRYVDRFTYDWATR